MSERVVLIRHGEDPTDDRVATFFRSYGIEPELRYPFKGDQLGEVDGSVAASVIYGGPFNVFETEKYPFLKDEHRWAAQCMAGEVPLLGICQGAQSIAYVLGAEVGPKPGEPHEFGYYRIHPTEEGHGFLPEGGLCVAQSHFHTFDIPAGAKWLAYSDGFAHQAMRYGDRTFAFQFHAEITREGFRCWQDEPDSYFGKPGAQDREEQNRLGAIHDGPQHAWFMNFLEDLFAPACRRIIESRGRRSA